jgi:hypothetical protein
MIVFFIGFFWLGLVVGVAVTEWLHLGGGWPQGFWQQRFRGRLRNANFPVGGMLLLIVTLPSILHWPPTGAACLGAAIGMSVAAVGWGLLYPLDAE